MTKSEAYKKSGVDIDSGNALVDRIKPLAQKTKRMEVISGIGGFAGLFALNNQNIPNPVLVASTDGVGTKLKLAIDLGNYSGLGQDLVGMCVNDLICCGAEPLFFLDYFATGKLDVDQAATIINSISTCLADINCTLLGGETAEMPGLYQSKDFDVAGFAVGIVDKDKIIEGGQVKFGSPIIGLTSSGFHSNGYSLVRNIIEAAKLDLNAVPSFDDGKRTLGEILLTPTKIYVNPIVKIVRQHQIMSMAHITGGGLLENLPRVLPKTCKAVLNKSDIAVPELFRYFQKHGQIDEQEMWRVFNMGIGYTMVVSAQDCDTILHKLNGTGYEARVIGHVAQNKSSDPAVEII